MRQVESSFRDFSGTVYQREDGQVVRTVNQCFKPVWECIEQSGLFPELIAAGRMISFSELPEAAAGTADNAVWKWLLPEQVPFISYPYEWSFAQLKDAALLTLDVQLEALRKDLSTVDASAYNVQFIGAAAKFIDLLSFDVYMEGSVWQGYRQFCMHFLAPLALQKYFPDLHRLPQLWIDGIPLETTSALLPFSSRLKPGLQMHVHMHARAEKKYADAPASAAKVRQTKISKSGLASVVESLQGTVRSLQPYSAETEWENYYTDTNYSDAAEADKLQTVNRLAAACLKKNRHSLAVDLGANTGKYSRILAKHADYVLAADIDPKAVGAHYQSLQQQHSANILPLVIDAANPSGAIGWANAERASFSERVKADALAVLALVHHLRITAGIPFARQAAWFSKLLKPGGHLIIEFIGKEDSQIQRLLAARDDIFEDIMEDAFLKAFAQEFRVLERVPLENKTRIMFLLGKR